MTQYSESPIGSMCIEKFTKLASFRSQASQPVMGRGPCRLCAKSPADVEYIKYWCADGLIDFAERVYFKDVQRTGQWASDVQRRGAADFLCRAVAIAKRMPFIVTQIDEVERLLEHDHRRVLDKAIRRIRELMPEQCPNRRCDRMEPTA